MNIYEVLAKCEGFDWDNGNLEKSMLKHKVTNIEAEQIFKNKPLYILEDNLHSQKEARYQAMGFADSDRYLFVVFTIRNNLVRIISARRQDKKERTIYNYLKIK